MSKPFMISQQQRSAFIARMNEKWQRKHEREEAWLDYLDDYTDGPTEHLTDSDHNTFANQFK